jgi:hypothetical protein
MAGAAANLHDPRLSTDGTGPAGGGFGQGEGGRANHYTGIYETNGLPSTTGPQPMVAVDDLDPAAMPLDLDDENDTDLTALRARRSHRAQPRRTRRSGRRRWPIVTTALVVLLAVVVGGGYIAWRWSQDQYYVGADSQDQVVIYRGVNQRIAGISLSHPFQQTGIQLAQVPAPYRQTVVATDAASSLSGARAIVANVQKAVSTCQQAYVALRDWMVRDSAYKAYRAQVAQASKEHRKPPPAVANPGPEPPPAGAMCPPSTAFGVATSALPPATGSS